jgi:predicted ATPase/DNA-binding SARP family transcriptional activator
MPVHLTSFIGRQDELSALQTILEQREVRLLTLTGPGGSGKSRLAARLAAEIGDTYEDGVCWVELADLAEASLVTQNIVMALDLGDPTMSPSIELLIQTLQRRQLLLVLDNCEHLLDECARLASRLLKDAPDLYILATSRERLAVPGEMTLVVHGLTVPDAIGFRGVDDPVARLLTYDAVELFVARAKLAWPTFELDAALAPAVWRICRQLDGIPLALELAAARLRILGAAQIAERVSDHLDLLAAKSDFLPDRQRTMRATLEWSHELLTEPERDLFRWLAAFRGSFSLEAVESIVAVMDRHRGDKRPAQSDNLPVDLLASLVDRSLVIVEGAGSGRTTYRLLETIRVFATEKLVATGQEELARDAHLGFYHSLTQTAEPKLKGPEQQQWVARLERENDNLRAALGRAIDRAQEARRRTIEYTRLALEMSGSLFWYWNTANYFTEGYRWSEAALALPGQEQLIAERAFVLFAAGTQAWLTGDFARARVHLDESLVLYKQREDELGIANVWMMLGRVNLYQGNARQAFQYSTDSVNLFRQLGAQHERGLTLGLRSAAAAMMGDYEPARSYAQEMLQVFKKIGDPSFIALAHIDLGWAAYHQGDLMAAMENLQEGLARSRQIDSRWLTAQSLNYLAEIARFQGKHKVAADYSEECLALAEEVGARAWLAQGTRNLAYASLYSNRPEEAAGLFLESLDHVRYLGDETGMLLALQGLATVAAGERAWSLAVTLNEAATTLREQTGPPRTPAERDDLARLLALMSEIPAEEQPAAVGGEPGTGQSGDIFSQARQVAALFRPRLIQVEPVSYDVSIYALGPTQVLREGQPLTPADWNYAKPRELLFFLVANEPLSKAQIGLVFWPDASPAQLRRNFRAALYRLRQALGGREWVVFKGGRYAFNRQSSFWYDVEAFEERISAARQSESSRPDQALAEYERAIRLVRGEFLEDVDLSEWALPRREELRQTFLQAHIRRAGLWAGTGRLEEAVDAYRQILLYDNLMESAHRGLMRTYALLGNRNRALSHYEDLRGLLADELGVEPASETQALYQRIRTNQEL